MDTMSILGSTDNNERRIVVVALNGTVRMVALQLSLSNPGAIPSFVKHLNQENQDESVKRRSYPGSVMIVKPTKRCSIAEFLCELEAAGYEMVDCLYQERTTINNPHSKKTYHMVRFVFARHEFVELSDYFKRMRSMLRAEVQIMCESAMWRIRIYSNPFYKNGQEILGQHYMSINIDTRQPFFRTDGKPATMWRRSKSGNCAGDASLPLMADCSLRIVSGSIQLVSA